MNTKEYKRNLYQVYYSKLAESFLLKKNKK